MTLNIHSYHSGVELYSHFRQKNDDAKHFFKEVSGYYLEITVVIRRYPTN